MLPALISFWFSQPKADRIILNPCTIIVPRKSLPWASQNFHVKNNLNFPLWNSHYSSFAFTTQRWKSVSKHYICTVLGFRMIKHKDLLIFWSLVFIITVFILISSCPGEYKPQHEQLQCIAVNTLLHCAIMLWVEEINVRLNLKDF